MTTEIWAAIRDVDRKLLYASHDRGNVQRFAWNLNGHGTLDVCHVEEFVSPTVVPSEHALAEENFLKTFDHAKRESKAEQTRALENFPWMRGA